MNFLDPRVKKVKVATETLVNPSGIRLAKTGNIEEAGMMSRGVDFDVPCQDSLVVVNNF